MADKQFRSKLFQAQPNQLFLDERVSKIVLPSAQDMEKEALDPENLAILMEEESEESEDEGVLQIFVGSAQSEVEPEKTWIINEDEEELFDFNSEESEEEVTVVIPLQISPEKSIVISPEPSEPAQIGVDPKYSEESEDEWEEIDWDDVTLGDILGETDDYFEDSDEEKENEKKKEKPYGESLGLWLDETIPEPLALTQTQEEVSSSKDFSFEALFNDEFSSEFDPLEDFSYEKDSTKDVPSEDKISIDLNDELPEIRMETEWWQHPFLIFFVALLGAMTLFMLLIQFIR